MAHKLDINGLILVNKPYGISSNALLQRVRHILKAKKAGHTGALDPLATGMLPICLGETTKFANILLDGNKSYSVEIELGKRTTTSDAEGEIIHEREITCTLEQIQDCITKYFIGNIKQQPSIWSALKYQGKPFYEYARKGINIPRPIRDITIYDIKIIDCNLPYLKLDIICSKGTYIRTLVDDLGEQLKCGAYVKNLHRNWVEGFSQYSMLNLEEIKDLATNNPQTLTKHILAIDAPAQHLPLIKLNDYNAWKLCQGMTIIESTANLNELYRVCHSEFGFLGIAQATQNQRLRGFRLVSYTQNIIKELQSRLSKSQN